MTVEVINMQSAGSRPITNFADSFARADQPFYVGNDWATILTASDTVSGIDFAANVNVSANQLVFGDGGLGNFNGIQSIAYPALINVGVVRTRSLTRGLFVQATLSAKIAGVDCSAGLMLMGNPNVETCYWMQFQSNQAFCQILRSIGSGQTLLTPAAFNNTVGHVYRFEFTFATAQNTLRSFDNGVLVDTTIDASAQRLQSGGIYGFAYTGSFTGQLGFQNFSGGILP